MAFNCEREEIHRDCFAVGPPYRRPSSFRLPQPLHQIRQAIIFLLFRRNQFILLLLFPFLFCWFGFFLIYFLLSCREDGSAEVQLGQTHVMGFVTAQLVQPYKDRPNEGTLSIFTEFSPMADPSFEPGRPGEAAVELGRVIDRGLR